jgi:hypothetical protein
VDYDQLPRSALIRLLQEHDAALLDAGRDGIVMSYTGRTAPWQIIRLVKPKLSRIIKKFSIGEEKAQSENEIWVSVGCGHFSVGRLIGFLTALGQDVQITVPDFIVWKKGNILRSTAAKRQDLTRASVP